MSPLSRLTVILRKEWRDHRQWLARFIVLVFSVLSGLAIVGFVWVTDRALDIFIHVRARYVWAPLILTPVCTGLIVWLTRRYAPGAAGSGIPQVMVALDNKLTQEQRDRFVSLRLSLVKPWLAAWGLLVGLSLGREGPSVQICAGIMRASRRLLPLGTRISEHALLVAGGAAGIAAAFNAPLAGIMFAVEELSRHPDQRNHGLIISAIVLSGLIGISVYGNDSYFGLIQTGPVHLTWLLPGLLVAIVTGFAGGLFALLLRKCLGPSSGVFGQWRLKHPVAFAVACGFAIALIGIGTNGETFGSGYEHSKIMLNNGEAEPLFYAIFKFIATWLTAWSGVPGGIFAPSLSIGGAIGNDVATLTGCGHAPALIALGMAGFLAAATQAPLTAFIIVMEMIGNHNMVLTLMTGSLIASGLSRRMTEPLYGALARIQRRGLSQG